MSISLIISTSLPAEATQDLTHELAQDLSRFVDCQATIAERDLASLNSEVQTKGSEISLAEILLTFLTSGAAVAFFDVCKTYFSREPTLTLNIKDGSGNSVSLSAKNLEEDQIANTLASLEDIIESNKPN